MELYVALTVDLELIEEKEVAVDFMNEDFEEDVGVDPMCSCHSVVQPRKSIRVRLVLDETKNVMIQRKQHFRPIPGHQ